MMASCLASRQARRTSENASRPPAEAPTPTTVIAPFVAGRGCPAAAGAARGFGVGGCGGGAGGGSGVGGGGGGALSAGRAGRDAGRAFAGRPFGIVFLRAMAAAADGTPVYRACAFPRTAAGSATT